MKKLALAVSVILLSAAVFSQNAKVVSAYNYLRNGQLDKAKQNIDEACVHEQTMGQAKTWFYRGNIYLQISISKEQKYASLDTNATQVAYDSYQKALKLEPDIQNDNLTPNSPKYGLIVLGEQFINKGAEFYQGKKIDQALTMFEMSKKISEIFKIRDTLATLYAGICAIQLKDIKKAKTYFEDLARTNTQQPAIYMHLANIYKTEGDTLKASKIVERGRNLMPNNQELIIAEINLYLEKGKVAEAQDLLNLAVAKDPNNHSLYFALGVGMDESGNFEQAEKSYLKAIELKPDYTDAYFNLGILYINKSLDIKRYRETLSMSENIKYDSVTVIYNELLEKAVPVLQKADSLKPNDISTLFSLKQAYALKGDMIKAKEYDEMIKALKK